MNVKFLAANSAGQLKRLFQAFYSVRQMDETDFISVRVSAEDIGAAHVIQRRPSSYFVGSLLKLAKPRLYDKTPPFFELGPPEPGDTEAICELARDSFTKADIFKILISAAKRQTRSFRSGHETISMEGRLSILSLSTMARSSAIFKAYPEAMNPFSI